MLVPLTLSTWLRSITTYLTSSAKVGKTKIEAETDNGTYHSTHALLVEIRRPVGLAGFVSSPRPGDRIATEVV
jgi:hypothetical protein